MPLLGEGHVDQALEATLSVCLPLRGAFLHRQQVVSQVYFRTQWAEFSLRTVGCLSRIRVPLMSPKSALTVALFTLLTGMGRSYWPQIVEVSPSR